MSTPIWHGLARQQQGLLARRQLNALGFDSDRVRNQILAARWRELTPRVVSTTTGPLTRPQALWLATLHTGGESLIGGLTAAAEYGLRRWDRPGVTVLVDDERFFEPMPGLVVVRTRRSLREFRDPSSALPCARLEPAVLLHAGYTRSAREAQGLLAACVQQRLTTPERLREWIERMRPLRRSKLLQRALLEIEGGSQSMAELDVRRMCRAHGLPPPVRQRARRGSDGRQRYTDAEWTLADGRTVVLEVDGGFHMEVEHWEDDLARERSLTSSRRLVVRASAREVRERSDVVARDLQRLGVPGRVPLDAV